MTWKEPRKKELKKLQEHALKFSKTKYDPDFNKEMKVAYVIHYDEVYVVIICPHCNNIHYHGSCRGEETGYVHRLGHCKYDKDLPKWYNGILTSKDECSRSSNEGYLLGIPDYFKRQTRKKWYHKTYRDKQ